MATRWQSAGFIEFELDFAGTDIHHVSSDDFSAGEHVWRVKCYPLAEKVGSVIYLSLVLGLTSDDAKCDDVDAILDAFLLGGDHGARAPSSSPHAQRSRFHLYPPKVSQTCGSCVHFMKWIVLDSESVTDGYVTFMVGVKVLGDCPIPVPSSDIAKHLGRLLDHVDGSTDVTFSVGAETFRAHSAVLAARSPVFKAQLFGSMPNAKTRSILLHGIRPETFRVLLRFMYTDALPGDELVESSSDVDLFHDLLAAADMHQLGRLKLLCARKLWDCVSPETVAKILGCAETNNCSELKSACLDFFLLEENFKVAVLTDEYFQLMQSFPSVIDEIRARRGFDRQT